MSSKSSSLTVAETVAQGGGLMEFLNAVEKIEMPEIESPLKVLFDHEIKPANLKEKFLCATFEIIAEKGADALSASELIKQTQSSKGALFHHFQTIDHLCIQSLEYFKQHVALGAAPDSCQNLEDYLQHVMDIGIRRNSTRYYAHLVNFFRDRAIRDERYRAPLKAFFVAHIKIVAERVMKFLEPGVDQSVVFRKIVFYQMVIERCSYHRLLYNEPTAFDGELVELHSFILRSLRNIK